MFHHVFNFFCSVFFNKQLGVGENTLYKKRKFNSACCIWSLSVNVCSKSRLFTGANAASCLCVRRRKLVEQLYLPSQTWDRTCPNRRRYLTSLGLDGGSGVSPELEEGKSQVRSRSTELVGDTMWTGAQVCQTAATSCPSACVWGGSPTCRGDRTGRWSSPSEVSSSRVFSLKWTHITIGLGGRCRWACFEVSGLNFCTPQRSNRSSKH